MNLLEAIGLPVSEEIPSSLPAEETEETAEYESLCKTLMYGSKWDPSAHPLARWLRRMEVPVYAQASIEAYLKIKAETQKWGSARLVEHPLRTLDKDDWRSIPVYNEPVPIEVLRLASALVQEFKGEVKFTVLHVTEDKDPFLQVEHKKSRESFIVAHWNEPGFRIVV